LKPGKAKIRKEKTEDQQPQRRPDQELVREALAGSQAAYQGLLKRHQAAVSDTVYRIVRNREETRDLVQETFMKAFGSLATYREEFRFSTWLHRIAANCAIDYIRKKKLEAFSLDQPVESGQQQVTREIPDHSYNPETDWVEKQRSVTIQKAIDSLPAAYREVIIFRHKEEKSYEEIAEILSIPVGTVKARIFRGRELLKKRLKAWRKGFAK
jgi:RNA polymerase sigma-70 factor (ECF subfamily)